MIRVSLISLSLASAAAAQTPGDLDRLWNTFMRVCPLMLTDPNAYVQTLQVPGPNGEPVFSQSPDGQITEFDTTIDGDVHHAQIAVVGKHQQIGCGMTSNPLTVMQAPTSADAGEAFFQKRIASYENIQVSGGRVAKQVSIGQGFVQADVYYQYLVAGLVPGIDSITMAIFGQGFHSLHMHRYIIAEGSQ